MYNTLKNEAIEKYILIERRWMRLCGSQWNRRRNGGLPTPNPLGLPRWGPGQEACGVGVYRGDRLRPWITWMGDAGGLHFYVCKHCPSYLLMECVHIRTFCCSLHGLSFVRFWCPLRYNPDIPEPHYVIYLGGSVFVKVCNILYIDIPV